MASSRPAILNVAGQIVVVERIEVLLSGGAWGLKRSRPAPGSWAAKACRICMPVSGDLWLSQDSGHGLQAGDVASGLWAFPGQPGPPRPFPPRGEPPSVSSRSTSRHTTSVLQGQRESRSRPARHAPGGKWPTGPGRWSAAARSPSSRKSFSGFRGTEELERAGRARPAQRPPPRLRRPAPRARTARPACRPVRFPAGHFSGTNGPTRKNSSITLAVARRRSIVPTSMASCRTRRASAASTCSSSASAARLSRLATSTAAFSGKPCCDRFMALIGVSAITGAGGRGPAVSGLLKSIPESSSLDRGPTAGGNRSKVSRLRSPSPASRGQRH